MKESINVVHIKSDRIKIKHIKPTDDKGNNGKKKDQEISKGKSIG